MLLWIATVVLGVLAVTVLGSEDITPATVVVSLILFLVGVLSAVTGFRVRRRSRGARTTVYVLAVLSVSGFLVVPVLGAPTLLLMFPAAVAVSTPSARRWLSGQSL